VTLSDLAKYSMTRSVAPSLCDSWASCLDNKNHANLFLAFNDVRYQKSCLTYRGHPAAP